MNFNRVFDEDDKQYTNHFNRIQKIQRYLLDKHKLVRENDQFYTDLFNKPKIMDEIKEFLAQKNKGTYIYKNSTRYIYMNTIVKAVNSIVGFPQEDRIAMNAYVSQVWALSKQKNPVDIQSISGLKNSLECALKNRKTIRQVKLICKLLLYAVSDEDSELLNITLKEIIETRVDLKIDGSPFLDLLNCKWHFDDRKEISVPRDFIDFFKKLFNGRTWLSPSHHETKYIDTTTISDSFLKSVGHRFRDVRTSLKRGETKNQGGEEIRHAPQELILEEEISENEAPIQPTPTILEEEIVEVKDNSVRSRENTTRCIGMTRKNKQCSRGATHGNFCKSHRQ